MTVRATIHDEYRADQRTKPVADEPPLSDYDPELSARVSGRGVPNGWPYCECGHPDCPDRRGEGARRSQ